jgi:endonuclease/exonuclease/phosphatase family metal-dependent hydrolase
MLAGDRSRITLKVLTVNTHKGFTALNRRFILHELREAVREVGPDIVFLQEVTGEHDKHAARFAQWPETSHYEFMADTIWADFAYGRNAVYPHGHHGNALLSKFPIVRFDNLDVSVGEQEKRGLLHCVLAPPGRSKPIHAICVHLGLRESHRQQQFELLGGHLEQNIPADEAVLIAGDFNDWRLRGHARLAESPGVKEVFVDAHGHAARTFPARLPFLRLDRIYVRGALEMRPLSMPKKPWDRLSDHAPLMAEVTL